MCLVHVSGVCVWQAARQCPDRPPQRIRLHPDRGRGLLPRQSGPFSHRLSRDFPISRQLLHLRPSRKHLSEGPLPSHTAFCSRHSFQGTGYDGGITVSDDIAFI